MAQGIVEARNGVEKLNLSCLEVPFKLVKVNPVNPSFNGLVGESLGNQEAVHQMIGRLFNQDFHSLARKGNLREDKEGLLGPRGQDQLVSLAVEGLVKEELMNGPSDFL